MLPPPPPKKTKKDDQIYFGLSVLLTLFALSPVPYLRIPV